MIQSRLDYLRGDRCTVSYSLQNHSYLWRRRFKICLISVFGISGTLHCHLEAVTTPSHTLAATPCLWAREKPWRRGTAASSTTGSPSRSCWLTAPGHLTGKKYTTLCCLWPQCDGKRERMFWWRGRLYHTPELIQLWCVRRRAQPHTTLAGRDKPTAIGAMKGPRLWTCSFCPKLEIIYRQILSETIIHWWEHSHTGFPPERLLNNWGTVFSSRQFEFFILRRKVSNSNFRLMFKHVISQQNFIVADWKTWRIKLQLLFVSKL